MKIYNHIFEKIISLENLFSAWDEFKKDKQHKPDVICFEQRLEENIFALHRDLQYKQYKHGAYTSFYIHDPKQRHIHKAAIRDRVLHHAVFVQLNPLFEPTFINNSFSCQVGKGTHKGVRELEAALRKVSHNYINHCFVLKCDVQKFFASVNHVVLSDIISMRVKDRDAMWLINEIINSFSSGLPIGNLTSQLFANVYMNELDQFVKHKLKVTHYFRYTDDFVIVSNDRAYLQHLLPLIRQFLNYTLYLALHPNKVSICKLPQGVDFLGYVLLPHHRIVKTKTKHRIFHKLHSRVQEYKQDKINRETLEQSLQSYLGVLSHANAYRLINELKNKFWFWLNE